MERLIGCHVSVSGGLELALDHGEAAGATVVQIHPSPPQRWNLTPFKKGVETKFLKRFEQSSVKAIYFHAIYLTNLASPDDEKFERARASLAHYLELADRMGAGGVIVHVGSAKDQPSMEAALERAIGGVDWIFEHTEGSSKLLLEVAAGSGSVIGASFQELKDIYDGVKSNTRLGFALDTQHMWASGYDILGKAEDVVCEIEKIFGIEQVHVIHVNDSKTELGSRVDRHDNIGQGKIGAAGLAKFLNQQPIAHLPLILETPALKDAETAKAEVSILRELCSKG